MCAHVDTVGPAGRSRSALRRIVETVPLWVWLLLIVVMAWALKFYADFFRETKIDKEELKASVGRICEEVNAEYKAMQDELIDHGELAAELRDTIEYKELERRVRALRVRLEVEERARQQAIQDQQALEARDQARREAELALQSFRASLALCESQPERALLGELIKLGDLKCRERAHVLHGRFTLELQRTIDTPTGRYRADFLLNSKLIVEVDGHEYHSSKEAHVYDRRRDRALKRQGFDTIRVAAIEVIKDARAVGAEVVGLLEIEGVHGPT